jgi:hypothetical protein
MAGSVPKAIGKRSKISAACTNAQKYAFDLLIADSYVLGAPG